MAVITLVIAVAAVLLVVSFGIGFFLSKWLYSRPSPSPRPTTDTAIKTQELQSISIVASAHEPNLLYNNNNSSVAVPYHHHPETAAAKPPLPFTTTPHNPLILGEDTPAATPKYTHKHGMTPDVVLMRAASQVLEEMESRSAIQRLTDTYKGSPQSSTFFTAINNNKPSSFKLRKQHTSEFLGPAMSIRNTSEVHVDEVCVLERIGGGAYGSVWLGDWHGAPVAIKCIVTNTEDEDSLGRAIREVVLSKKLTHPNVVQCFSWTVLAQPSTEQDDGGGMDGDSVTSLSSESEDEEVLDTTRSRNKTRDLGATFAALRHLESSVAAFGREAIQRTRSIPIPALWNTGTSSTLIVKTNSDVSDIQAQTQTDDDDEAAVMQRLPMVDLGMQSTFSEAGASVMLAHSATTEQGAIDRTISTAVSVDNSGDHDIEAAATTMASTPKANTNTDASNDNDDIKAANTPPNTNIKGTPDSFNSEEGFGSPVRKRGTSGTVASVFELESLKLNPSQALLVVVMEHCDLGSLHRALSRKAFIPSTKWPFHRTYRALLRTAAEVAKGMNYIHEHHVVHGDLKPGNVLLKTHRADRRGYVAKVSDFGLSRLVAYEDETLNGGASSSNNAISTVAYTAPEAFDEAVPGKPGDVYAFGIMMWEMFYCQQPYQGLFEAQVCAGVVDGTLRPEFDPTCPIQYKSLAERCWHQQPIQRPTFASIWQELARIELQFRAEWHRQHTSSTTADIADNE